MYLSHCHLQQCTKIDLWCFLTNDTARTEKEQLSEMWWPQSLWSLCTVCVCVFCHFLGWLKLRGRHVNWEHLASVAKLLKPACPRCQWRSLHSSPSSTASLLLMQLYLNVIAGWFLAVDIHKKKKKVSVVPVTYVMSYPEDLTLDNFNIHIIVQVIYNILVGGLAFSLYPSYSTGTYRTSLPALSVFTPHVPLVHSKLSSLSVSLDVHGFGAVFWSPHLIKTAGKLWRVLRWVHEGSVAERYCTKPTFTIKEEEEI